VSQESPGISAQEVVAGYLRLLHEPLAAPDISADPLSTALPKRDTGHSCALLLSPHPDDECLMGALPLRLRRERNWQVVNVAVTLGSNVDRRAERAKELAKACAVLDFQSVLSEKEGFSDITLAAQALDAAAWAKKVERITKIIADIRPQVLFMPHAEDRHATHIGAHFLGMDALAKMPKDFACAVVLTEYWSPLAEPNTMIGIGEGEMSALMSALACHVGEVTRNAYDRRFPSYLIDTVRRGERLSGAGKKAPAMDFAQMVQLGVWLGGKFVPSALNRFVGAQDSLGALFD
jgi:LmbE family N-acetylglucosaminyl deacetylase